MKTHLSLLFSLLILASCGVRDPVTVHDPTEDVGPDEVDMGHDTDIDDGGVVELEDMAGDVTQDAEPTPPDMMTEDMEPTPDMANQDMGHQGPFSFELGGGQPFEAWTDGQDLPVVAGPQGGFHTEHTVHVDSRLSNAQLNDAQLSVSVATPDETFADGTWIFFDTQWTRAADDDWTVSLPPLLNQDGMGHYDTDVTVSGVIELADGRSETFSADVTLVSQQ